MHNSIVIFSFDQKILLFLIVSVCDSIGAIKLYHQQRMMHPVDVNIIDFNVEDIFNDDLIPVQMVTDQLKNLLNTHNSANVSQFHLPELMHGFNNTDLSTAVLAMVYHRRMMNEYLLSSYLAEQIAASISNSTAAIEKRVGKAKNDSETDDGSNTSKIESPQYNNHKLIDDEGSSRYSSWLKRMATFEDIQNQLQNKISIGNGPKRKTTQNRRQSLTINVEPTYSEINADDGLEFLEDGDITGYAYTNTPNENFGALNPYKNHQQSLMDEKLRNLYAQGISKTGYDNGYDDYAAPPPPSPHPHPVSNLAPETPSKQIKEIGLKDITDIALTTLAFLSFGMFILQVLMCITMNKDDTSNMVMLPMEGVDSGDIPADDNTEEIRRKRRSITSDNTQHIDMINNLAKRALFSINAVTSISRDEGTCHYYSLCENNKFARYQHNRQKLWIPIWSLGISWLTTKLNNFNNTIADYNPIMNSLKAVIIGLSNENCVRHYSGNCKI